MQSWKRGARSTKFPPSAAAGPTSPDAPVTRSSSRRRNLERRLANFSGFVRRRSKLPHIILIIYGESSRRAFEQRERVPSRSDRRGSLERGGLRVGIIFSESNLSTGRASQGSARKRRSSVAHRPVDLSNDFWPPCWRGGRVG
jgi:hypothetical protein